MDLAIRINDETHEIEGDVPEQLQTILKRIEESAETRGRGKGIEQAAADAKRQIEDAVSAKARELEAKAPFEKARLSQLEDENNSLSSKLADLTSESSSTTKALKDAHAKDLLDRTQRIDTLQERVKSLTATSLRGEALLAGAREESLDELELILQHYIGYTAEMTPFVKGPDGQPVMVQGREQTIGSFVKDYLEKHSHHRKAPTSYRPGQARHGASLDRQVPASEREAARARVEQGDRSPQAINALFEANRQRQPAG